MAPQVPYLAATVFASWADFSTGEVAAVVALGLLAAYLVAGAFNPAVLLRPVWRLVCRTIYRLRVYGLENVPASGPTLLICNHVSYVDWLLIWAACPRRARFTAWAGWTRNPLLRFCLKVSGTILIDGAAGPKELTAALKRISAALDRGECVCIFPEGILTRTGAMHPFHRGFEHVLQQCEKPVAVVPVCIAKMWGSIFSYWRGRLFWKWPENFPYPVAVVFGKPIPQNTPAAEARREIQELSAEADIRDSDRLLPMHRRFIRVAARWRQLFRPCLIDTTAAPARTISYAKAAVGAIVIARWLKPRIGVEPNVGLWLPSSVGGALANIALALLGRTTVNLNYTAGIEAVRSAVRQTGMKTIITSKRFLARMPLELGPDITLIPLEDAVKDIGSGQRLRTFLMVLLLPGWMMDRWVLRLGRRSIDDIATIVFSSGSTGEPKGVMLSHRNIACNADSMIAHIGVDHQDRILGILPFFHSFGYTVTLWVPLVIGASAVYFPDPRQGKEIGELCRTHLCTVMLATATFLRFYLRRCEADDFRSLRYLICGAEKLPTALAHEFNARFQLFPLEGYGCSELSPVVSSNVNDREIAGHKQLGNRLGTVGQPVPGVAIQIFDPDTLMPLPIGKEGLVFGKGANVMVGYLHKPELTAQVVLNGWYNTGDMGRLDEDGFLTITGRLSRFAKVAGEMIPIEKVEEDLLAILGGERLLAVTAVPDNRRGERLVVLHLPELPIPIPDLLDQLGQRGLPNLWQPDARDFHSVAEMPLLGSGKLDLRRLKELALEVSRNR